MATPSILTVSPNHGPTAGRNVVDIVGAGFRVRPDVVVPPPALRSRARPTVRVLFGEDEAEDVQVYSSSRLVCAPPPGNAGPVSVTVINLDNAGRPIPGERATLTNAYSYGMPSFVQEGSLLYVIRTLIIEMRRQIMPNVRWKTQVEYDENPSTERVEPAKLPSLTIVGPTVPENRFYSVNGFHAVETGGGLRQIRSPKTVDMHFTLVVETDNSMMLVNLWQLVETFFHENKFLIVKNIPGALNSGVEKYELEMERKGLRNTGVHSADNLHRFSGGFNIIGVDIYGRADSSSMGTVTEPVGTAADVDLEVDKI